MKITNRTEWRTDQLRAFVSRVAGDELDAAQRRRAGAVPPGRLPRGEEGGAVMYDDRDGYLTDDERLTDRLTETPAQRRERIAEKAVDPEMAAALRRLWRS